MSEITAIAARANSPFSSANTRAQMDEDRDYLLAELRKRDETLWRVERLAARWATTPALRKGTSAVELRAALDDKP